MSEIFKDFSLLIILGGALQGIALGILLLAFKRGNTTANRLLAILLILVGYSSIVATLFYSQYLLKLPQLFATQSATAFLLAPTIYLYLKTLGGEGIKSGFKDVFHLLPFLVFTALVLPFYLSPAAEKTQMLENIYSGAASLNNVPFNKAYFHIGLLLQALFYTPFIIKTAYFSENRTRSQGPMIKAFGTFWVMILLIVLARYLSFYQPGSSIIVPVIFSFGIYILAYWTLVKQGFFFHVFQPASKYKKSVVLPEKAQKLSKELVDLLEHENVYRDPELTAPKLAARISISNHQLSQIINEELNDSFYNLVNRWRVNDAKTKLMDASFQHLSIEGIGQESGFKSKSAFYASFKKFTGQTPTEFRKAN